MTRTIVALLVVWVLAAVVVAALWAWWCGRWER